MSLLRRIFVTGETSGETARVTNGGLDANIQDQFTMPLDLRFIQATGATDTLAADTVPGASTITLVDSTGFTAGVVVGVFDTAAGKFYFGIQIGAPAGNVITLDTPIDKVYPVGSNVIAAISNAAVNGVVTPQIFQVGPVGVDIDVDITRILGVMTSAAAMDDSLFGSVSALTNGCVLRVNNAEIHNLWNAKTNGNLQLLGYDFAYSLKAPAGVYGCRFRISYAGPSKHGVTIRLAQGEKLEFVVQDDLTGLTELCLMAQGHIVE